LRELSVLLMVESFEGSVMLGLTLVDALSVAFTEPIVPLLKEFLSGLVANGEVDLQAVNNNIKNGKIIFFTVRIFLIE
jgi:hypothetical protein